LLSSSSALNAAYATAIGTTAAAGLTMANREIDTAAAFGVDQSLAATGAMVIAANGAVTETGGATLAAADLRLTGSTSSFTLNNANQIGILAATVGALSLYDTTDLTTGSMRDSRCQSLENRSSL
jgi:aminopeptidase N